MIGVNASILGPQTQRGVNHVGVRGRLKKMSVWTAKERAEHPDYSDSEGEWEPDWYPDYLWDRAK